MLDIFFGWGKASKCKKMMKKVKVRVKMLKTKRNAIVRMLREDVAELIMIGYHHIAFNRAEQLFKDKNIKAVYELLDNFCEFILINLSYIRRNKDCPNDINEAVSSLIYASARCGELPELCVIRKLFGERYGQRFKMTALELLPGNLVNLEVIERLSIQSVSDDMKQRLVDEIARDYCLQPEILAIEYTSELQQQVKEHRESIQTSETDAQNNGSRDELSRIEDPDANNIQGKAIYVDSASTCLGSTILSHCQNDYDVISPSTQFFIDQKSSPDVLESPLQYKLEKIESSIGVDSRDKVSKEERKMTASSSESLPQFPDEMIIYLDDIEEVRSSVTRAGSCQDQRVFKFKSPVRPNNERTKNSGDMKRIDHDDSWSEMSRQSKSRKKVKEAIRKKSRKRSVSIETVSTDIDCMIYYDKPCKKHPTHTLKSRRTSNSCRFSTSNCRDDHGAQPQNQKGGITTIQTHQRKLIIRHNFNQCHSCRSVEPDTEMEWFTFYQNPRRRNRDHDAITLYNQGKITSPTAKELGYQCKDLALRPEGSSHSGTRKESKTTYLRAMTMPQEHCKDRGNDSVSPSRSLPVQSPRHVHPNLPDYDDIAAKFMALKKEHMRNKFQ